MDSKDAITQQCIEATRANRGKVKGQDGALTLTLYPGDCLVVDNRIVLKCADIRVTGKSKSCKRVLIGTLAPGNVEVDRGEVWLQKRASAVQEAKS